MFSGSIVAIVTPMAADGSIEWDRLDSLIDWHIEAGTTGIVAAGTTGESATLDMEEHLELVTRTTSKVAGRIAVIAGSGANSTTEAIELTKGACAAGVDACLSVVPYYNKPPQHGLEAHFTSIADASSVPVILYNVPSRTITDLADETLALLSRHPLIGGIKDATGNIDRLRKQRRMIDDPEFCYLSGDDSTSCAYVRAGGDGVISITANIAPKLSSQMIATMIAGYDDEATSLDEQLQPFYAVQGVEANPIPIKWALCQADRIGVGIRSPLAPLSEQYHQRVSSAAASLH